MLTSTSTRLVTSRPAGLPALPARRAAVVVRAHSSKASRPFADGFIKPGYKAGEPEKPAPDSALGLMDALGAGFVAIFSPPKDSIKDWSGTSSAFSGRISHAGRKPFRDGYKSSAPVPAEEAADDLWSYLSGAIGRVMGAPSAQDAPFGKTLRKGYTGSTGSSRSGRGFHSRIY